MAGGKARVASAAGDSPPAAAELIAAQLVWLDGVPFERQTAFVVGETADAKARPPVVDAATAAAWRREGWVTDAH